MFNMSAAMGPRFAEVATEFSERIKKLGPSPIKPAGNNPGKAATDAVGAAAPPVAAIIEEGQSA
jgi:hypothetical protein